MKATGKVEKDTHEINTPVAHVADPIVSEVTESQSDPARRLPEATLRIKRALDRDCENEWEWGIEERTYRMIGRLSCSKT